MRKNVKKVIAPLLAAAMALSCTVCVSAAEDETIKLTPIVDNQPKWNANSSSSDLSVLWCLHKEMESWFCGACYGNYSGNYFLCSLSEAHY